MKIEEKNVMGHRDPKWFDVRITPNGTEKITGNKVTIFSCKSESDRREFLRGLKGLMKKFTVEPFELSTRINSINGDLK